jgi:hypothetical protein
MAEIDKVGPRCYSYNLYHFVVTIWFIRLNIICCLAFAWHCLHQSEFGQCGQFEKRKRYGDRVGNVALQLQATS